MLFLLSSPKTLFPRAHSSPLLRSLPYCVATSPRNGSCFQIAASG
ncbi:hypothetical protein CGRA01v4_07096 [Colletotrichum graminicola]|nr:hypothetical protein CGRA01v4_07096 [Colletotrichum graminicola]